MAQFTVNDSYVAIQGHLMASGHFAEATIGEPAAWGDSGQLYGAIWTMGTRSPYVSFDSTTRVYDTRVRLYTQAFTSPLDSREFVLARAVQQIASDLAGDYTLGGTVRELDIAGQFGPPMRARWGHAAVAGVMYRIVDIDIGLVINNSSVTSI